MNKIYHLGLASALTCLASTALAETFNYTNISVRYTIFSEDINGIPEDLEGDGVSFGLSLNIAPNIAIGAGYSTGSADVTSGGTTVSGDVDSGSVGILFHTPINQTTDFMAGVGLIKGNVDIEVNGVFLSSEDANGNSIFVGIRTMVASNLELNGSIDRTKIENESGTGIGFGAKFYLDKLLSLNAGYSFDSDGAAISFGATKYF